MDYDQSQDLEDDIEPLPPSNIETIGAEFNTTREDNSPGPSSVASPTIGIQEPVSYIVKPEA